MAMENPQFEEVFRTEMGILKCHVSFLGVYIYIYFKISDISKKIEMLLRSANDRRILGSKHILWFVLFHAQNNPF